MLNAQIYPLVTSFGESLYGAADIQSYLPPLNTNPNAIAKYKLSRWWRSAELWFNEGLHRNAELMPKKGIDKERAIYHINAIINSFFLEKEVKIQAVSFLMKTWFEFANMVPLQTF